MDKEAAAKLKAEGNELFRAEKFAEAAEKYGKAIEADPTEAALYSNRAACFAGLEKWIDGLKDATTCILIRPDWPKGYFRRALALSKTGCLIEARAMCDAGIALDKDSKEIQDLRFEIQEMIKNMVAFQKEKRRKNQPNHACEADFHSDKVPSEDFRLVFQGKSPSKGADLTLAFEKSRRTLAHVAVMTQHTRVVKELLERGANFLAEDQMGFTPLHFAHVLHNDGILAALGDLAQQQPMSSKHNATPQDLRAAVSFGLKSPDYRLRVAGKDGKAELLDPDQFLRKMGCRYTRDCYFCDFYLHILYSSVLDAEGHALLADAYKQGLAARHRESREEARLALAYLDEKLGYGVFALEDFAAGDYVCGYAGVIQDLRRATPNSTAVMTILPVDRFPFKTDATNFRSLGAYINHSAEANLRCDNIVSRGAHMIVFVAARAIAAGEQLSFDYKGRVRCPVCLEPEVLKGDGTFETRVSPEVVRSLPPLDAPRLAALRALSATLTPL